MKKVLLGLCVFAGFSAAAQTFTVDDTLSAGDFVNYYVVDSNATDLAGTTGAGVTWDYSTLTGYVGSPTNLDTIINKADSPYAASFPNADYNDNMNGGTSLFFSNTPDSVIVYGYRFEVDGNEVILRHDIDPMKSIDFPMSLGSTFQDSIYGQFDAPGFSLSGEPTAGEVTVTADGTGTLQIGATSIPNVIRIKLVEILEATITIFGMPTQGFVTRTVYSYYDLANQNEPVFIHASIDVTSTAFNGGYSAVYSTVDVAPSGISEAELEEGFEIYPNPATDFIQISSPENTSEIQIINSIGQTVQTITKPSTSIQLDTDEFENGVYLIQISVEDKTLTKKLIIK